MVIVFLAAVGATVSASETRRGVGVSPDSRNYLAAAATATAGQFDGADGRPLAKFPPLYPLTLAVPIAVGMSPLASARLIDALWFAAFVASVGYAAWSVRASGLAALLAGGLVLALHGMLTLGAMAWSEPLGIALALTSLVWLDERRTASATLMAAAMLTRYALGACWLAGLLVLCRRREWRCALRWSAIAWTPLILWLARNALVAHTATSRTIGWHPASFREFRMGLGVLGAWVLGRPWTYAISVPAALLALAAFVIAARRGRETSAGTLALAALVYLACVWLARAVADPVIPFDERILAPVAAIGAALLAAAAVGAVCSWRGTRAHVVTAE